MQPIWPMSVSRAFSVFPSLGVLWDAVLGDIWMHVRRWMDSQEVMIEFTSLLFDQGDVERQRELNHEGRKGARE